MAGTKNSSCKTETQPEPGQRRTRKARCGKYVDNLNGRGKMFKLEPRSTIYSINEESSLPFRH